LPYVSDRGEVTMDMKRIGKTPGSSRGAIAA